MNKGGMSVTVRARTLDGITRGATRTAQQEMPANRMTLLSLKAYRRMFRQLRSVFSMQLNTQQVDGGGYRRLSSRRLPAPQLLTA